MRTHGNRYSLPVRYLTRHLKQFNPRTRSNVAHHYDLDGRLYSLFLDADRQYSCACFETPEMTLDDAQLAKKRHIAAKLLVKGGQRVLDIGSGWGGLGLYLAEIAGADLTGIALSIATSMGHSTASSRSACSNMSGSSSTILIFSAAPSSRARTA